MSSLQTGVRSARSVSHATCLGLGLPWGSSHRGRWIHRYSQYRPAQSSPGRKESNSYLSQPFGLASVRTSTWSGCEVPTRLDAASLVPGEAQEHSLHAAQSAEVNVSAAELHI